MEPRKAKSVQAPLMDMQRPCVFRGGTKCWPPATWSLEEWKQLLRHNLGDRVKVRMGSSVNESKTPQWERSCANKEIDIEQLFSNQYQNQLIEQEKWAYFDYKYLIEMFPDEVLDKFDWGTFGLEDRNGKDSTLWIGTEGAHTPCHKDSYGYNLVAQLHGSKTWILAPPEADLYLKPSRIPYEESSVYSRINFQNVDSLADIPGEAGMLKVTLCPGDVLYVPRHWWHSVQNTGLGISVNTWVPCRDDAESKLEEAMVRLQAILYARSINRDDRKMLLNPNEDDIVDCDIDQLTGLIQRLAKILAKRVDGFPEDHEELSALNLVPETKYPNLIHFTPLHPYQDTSNDKENQASIKKRKLDHESLMSPDKSKLEMFNSDMDNSNSKDFSTRSKDDDFEPASSNPTLNIFLSLTSKQVIKASCDQLIQTYRVKR